MSSEPQFPFKEVVLPPTADFHVHLRDGAMMETVVPTIAQGGVDTVYVMPNLTPPITTVAAALDYRARLQRLAPEVTYLMTLYLHPSITPATITEAAQAGIAGVKVYPAGVTTNSDAGVVDLAPFYPVFEAMQTHDLVLNLHGEVTNSHASLFEPPGWSEARPPHTVLTAEEAFLPTLATLHAAFPRLRIVLEHCTTRAALAAVRACGPAVAATITAHHLFLTSDDWAGDALNYCKPVAKTPLDRVGLVRAVVEQRSRFFFGSDSAPHPRSAKAVVGGGKKAAAGCFTQGYATQLVVQALEEGVRLGYVQPEEVTQEALEEFLGSRGRRFYHLPAHGPTGRRVVVEKKSESVVDAVTDGKGVEVVPFRAKEKCWSLRWQ